MFFCRRIFRRYFRDQGGSCPAECFIWRSEIRHSSGSQNHGSLSRQKIISRTSFSFCQGSHHFSSNFSTENNHHGENLNVHKACWIEPESLNHPEFIEFKRVKQRFLATDKQGQLVFFADSIFSLQMTEQKYPSIKFHLTSEF